ncbi:hypothetical protein [Nostoc sp.]|uniref:hypothetical protein n=1 Tax=Nostoc sp. TaxID=1180 RepID=UPI003FA5F2F0
MKISSLTLPTELERCQILKIHLERFGIKVPQEYLEAIAKMLQRATQSQKPMTVLIKAEAIGNDMTRAASELRKLYIFGSGRKLEFAEVKELVPCQTQSSLQLASAIRQGVKQSSFAPAR